ncbi:hypothetical protein HXA31_20510 [Salipaludibacillus agaradhaerens]|jgi:hypothetical protein|uniref:Uncharacterized protein n=1 Tax=Salipaludibacillus agaradhaerens TaxID=76935 RepID=A0A9Q4FZ05_SALAG|nr:hypothetical protein [Salipaludibacillus agaradhaerens]MCR6096871.1 hypothetical protein [Salipaludibacillus agaradhaerens]MCR6116715.1 hypothetical protein [Salipaludibacillus agaradhaerens]
MSGFVMFFEDIGFRNEIVFEKWKKYEVIDELDEWLFVSTTGEKRNNLSKVNKQLEGVKFVRVDLY